MNKIIDFISEKSITRLKEKFNSLGVNADDIVGFDSNNGRYTIVYKQIVTKEVENKLLEKQAIDLENKRLDIIAKEKKILARLNDQLKGKGKQLLIQLPQEHWLVKDRNWLYPKVIEDITPEIEIEDIPKRAKIEKPVKKKGKK